MGEGRGKETQDSNANLVQLSGRATVGVGVVIWEAGLLRDPRP